jgi:predicted tellurium resistance membrane protein TerC
LLLLAATNVITSAASSSAASSALIASGWDNIVHPLPELTSIIVAEVLFSLENIIVLDRLASSLPPAQQRRAHKWGLIGALTLRIASIVLMTWAKSVYAIALLGALHMVFGASLWFFGLGHGQPHLFKKPIRQGQPLLKVILLMELTDLFFSFDNVAVAVSFSKQLPVSILGVVIGVLIVRFAWRRLKLLLQANPRLEDTCQFVAGLLGLQILLKLLFHAPISPWLDLFTVIVAIVLAQLFDARRIGTKLRRMVTGRSGRS